MEKDPISREDSLAFCNGTKPLSDLPDGVAAIPLTRSTWALVDLCNLMSLSALTWYWGSGYALSDSGGRANRIRLRMHRVILHAHPNQGVDHVNGNGLDNRRINLRLATQLQNTRNRTSEVVGISRFKGVSTHPKGWRAYIGMHNEAIFLGSFGYEEDAARAYDRAAVALYGEFARLNFPQELEDRKQETFCLRQSRKQGTFSSKYVGVVLSRGKYIARIKGSDVLSSTGKSAFQIGSFDSEDDAARAYDRIAVLYGSDKRKLNFPNEAQLRLTESIDAPHLQFLVERTHEPKERQLG